MLFGEGGGNGVEATCNNHKVVTSAFNALWGSDYIFHTKFISGVRSVLMASIASLNFINRIFVALKYVMQLTFLGMNILMVI
jgi:hypothetical protein